MSVTEHDPESCPNCGRLPTTLDPYTGQEQVCCCDCDHDDYQDGQCTSCGAECEHGDFDHGVCGFCGEDCMADIMARAHEACEGER